MSDITQHGDSPSAAEPEIRSGRRVSAVWLVPIVALVAAGWVAWRALAESGPTVEITFKTAEGLEAGRTPVKYKDVQVGMVNAIRLTEDLDAVIVEAALNAELSDYATDQTRFWVVRPRISSGGVSGLGTLFSGAYVAMDPSADGRRTREFQGLEDPPVVTQDEPGTHFRLQAPGLGALSLGAPVYFREIRAGEVVSYELAEDGRFVELRIFVRAPYDQFVNTNTRFWQAGGVNVQLGAEGLTVETGSLATLLIGGVTFDTPPSVRAGDAVEEDRLFPLFRSRRASEEEVFATRKVYYLANFTQDARGLVRGAPVELHGLKIGVVSDVTIEYLPEGTFKTSALLEIYPDRVQEYVQGDAPPSQENLAAMVGLGLRAQLKTGNLLTGALYVDIDIHPDAEPAEVGSERGYTVIPTIPGRFEELAATLASIASRLDQVPFDEIGANLNETAAGMNQLLNSDQARQTLSSLAELMEDMQEVARQMSEGMMPAVTASLAHTERVLSNAEALLAPDSPMSIELKRLLREMADAARSIRSMAEYLEQHPEALIRGKAEEEQ
ncbi:MAG: MlaD family protein [Gammaproteobacteria bacterium]|jgi:paraquat-inducible protein B